MSNFPIDTSSGFGLAMIVSGRTSLGPGLPRSADPVAGSQVHDREEGSQGGPIDAVPPPPPARRVAHVHVAVRGYRPSARRDEPAELPASAWPPQDPPAPEH